MTARVSRSLPTIDEEIEIAAWHCRNILNTKFAELDKYLPGAPKTAEGWFDLLSGIPSVRKSVRSLSSMRSSVPGGGAWPPGAAECYAVLQSYRAALPRLASLPLDEAVKRLYCATSKEVDCTNRRWSRYFDCSTEPFAELAKIATLRRFTAGQLSFDITTLPRSWLLKIHPMALPRLIRELAIGFGGFGPFAVPHLCHLRPNPLVILEAESCRSFWRIAKCLELQPSVKGLMAASWFYSAEVGIAFPHLAWLRDFYVEQGAYLAEMEIADADAGFMIGSAKRRQLYEQGMFRPRQTLVLWRREAMLAWAEAHPEFGDDALSPDSAAGESRRLTASAGLPIRIASAGCRSLKRNGRFGSLGAARLLNSRPKTYIFLSLIAPATAAALIASLAVHPWAALPSFMAGLTVMWLVQYFFLQ